MKPQRIRMAHNLVINYELYKKMKIYVRAGRTRRCTGRAPTARALQRPFRASFEDMTKFHTDDYIKFLQCIMPQNLHEYSQQMQRCTTRRGAA